jgi:DNA repair exonuclease SbcCD ATPase subunit
MADDLAQTAKVTLNGSVNGEEFTITRAKTASKGSLVFRLNGEDLTTQSAKETQVVIEEKLGVSQRLLSRTMFHGQHAMNELLETTDASFKDELSLVVPLSLWQKAAALARAKNRATGKRAAELNGMVSMRTEDLDRLCMRLDRAEQALQNKKSSLEAMETEFYSDTGKTLLDSTDGIDFDDIENQLQSVSTRVFNLEAQRDALSAQRDADLLPLKRSLSELTASLASLAARCNQEEREVYAATLKLDAAKATIAQLQEKWSVDLSSGIEGLSIAPETCPTCLQPVNSKGTGHSHDDLQTIATAEIFNAHNNVKSREAAMKDTSERLEAWTRSLTARQKTKTEMESDLNLASQRWAEEFEKIDENLHLARKGYAALSEQLNLVAKSSQMAAKRETAQLSIDTAKGAVEFAANMYNEIEKEAQDGEARLKTMKSEMEEQNQAGSILSELGELFGQRGVQTFVLQTAVEALEAMSQTYLDDLSDGAQRLRLSLDAGDRITRTALVSGADGNYKERPLASLSGGQWRRCSLALTFGFAELLARKGKIRPSLCVLDEPLTHLDQFGRAKVGEVIRRILRPPGDDGLKGFGGLGMSTVIIILQDLAAEELDEAFDCIDEVVKENSQSRVKIDELS